MSESLPTSPDDVGFPTRIMHSFASNVDALSTRVPGAEPSAGPVDLQKPGYRIEPKSGRSGILRDLNQDNVFLVDNAAYPLA